VSALSDETLEQFTDAYDTHRVLEQMEFYRRRSAEYERADSQAGGIAEILLFIAGICGVVAAAWSEGALWMGVTAATLAAAATVVGSWAELVGFSKNAELYGAAEASLALMRPKRPKSADGPDLTQERVGTYLRGVEEVLLGEVRTWGEQWKAAGDRGQSSA